MNGLQSSEVSVLRAAFEDAPFEFWARDEQGRCIVQNAAARRWGGQLGELTAQTQVPAEVRAAWEANNARAYAGELVQNDVDYLIDGVRRYFRAVVVPLRSDAGVRGILGFNIETTDRVKAELALRESERRLGEAMRVGHMGYLDWNLVTNEIHWSPETYRLFGWAEGFVPTIDATVGMVPAEDRPFVEQRLQEAIQARRRYDIVHRMVRADGRVIHVHAQSEVTRDADGKPLRMLGTVVDVTERVQADLALRASESRLNQALRAARAGAWEVGVHSGEVASSPETLLLYGFDPAGPAPTRDDWLARLHDDDRPRALALLKDVAEGRVPDYNVELRVVLPGGEVRWVLCIGQLERGSSGPLKLVGISIDITDRKRAEQELRQVDRRRSEFLGVLSHELRNPLTPILNSVYVLENTAPGTEPARKAVATIHRQARHLARLVDDLLDITRISSGKVRLQLERVDLTELVRRAVDDHRTLLGGREVTVALPQGPIWVQGDGTRLAQVVGNLVNNAAKFTHEGQAVRVSLRAGGGRAVLEVHDTGLGMDAETLRHLFVPFAQADRSLDRTRGGLGLGLALVKSLVELHGGEVSARSDGPGRGATFSVELACEPQQVSTAESAAEQAPPSAARRVLVIEDNLETAESLADVLTMFGHQVAVAYDGTSGLNKAREVTPDVILCDLGLPGALDGYGVARSLRQDASLAKIYCVALSGYALPEDVRRARDAGFDGHLAKPPDVDALKRLLEQAPPRRGAP